MYYVIFLFHDLHNTVVCFLFLFLTVIFFFIFFSFSYFIFYFFFFFQAEDGIRDIGVTGVQTCALPISSCKIIQSMCCSLFIRCGINISHIGSKFLSILSNNIFTRVSDLMDHTNRSEERRVGKECRYRWSSYHLKKKRYNNERRRGIK